MILLYIPSVDHYHQETVSTDNPSEIHDEESTGSFNCIITELKYRISFYLNIYMYTVSWTIPSHR